MSSYFNNNNAIYKHWQYKHWKQGG